MRWTPLMVDKLANCVRKTKFYRVELRGNRVEEVTPEEPGSYAAIRFAGREDFIPIEEYRPEEFQIYDMVPLAKWWECAFVDTDELFNTERQ